MFYLWDGVFDPSYQLGLSDCQYLHQNLTQGLSLVFHLFWHSFLFTVLSISGASWWRDILIPLSTGTLTAASTTNKFYQAVFSICVLSKHMYSLPTIPMCIIQKRVSSLIFTEKLIVASTTTKLFPQAVCSATWPAWYLFSVVPTQVYHLKDSF